MAFSVKITLGESVMLCVSPKKVSLESAALQKWYVGATRLTLIRPWCEASHCFRSHHLFILVPPSSTIPFRPRLIGQSQLGWSLLWGPDCMDDAIDQSVKEKKMAPVMGWHGLDGAWKALMVCVNFPIIFVFSQGWLGATIESQHTWAPNTLSECIWEP